MYLKWQSQGTAAYSSRSSRRHTSGMSPEVWVSFQMPKLQGKILNTNHIICRSVHGCQGGYKPVIQFIYRFYYERAQNVVNAI